MPTVTTWTDCCCVGSSSQSSSSRSSSSQSSSSRDVVPVTCCDCTIAPRVWQFTFSGVIDDLCTFCDSYYNGTYQVTFGARPDASAPPSTATCVWDGAETDGECGGGIPRFRLEADGANNMILRVGLATAIAEYTGACSDWSGRCLQPLTLFLEPTFGPECDNWPAAIILTAA